MAKSTVTPQTLKGFRDILPEKMRIRNYVLSIFKDVFESFGFEPLETPSLEYATTLLGKYGEEADRLVYRFKDRGGREVAMPYDLTVPVSKVLAMYQNKIPLPFKRYQIQRVWRAEKPQKERYREILQCDVDIFGVASPLADAEIIAVIYNVLGKLGFKKFTTRINSRQALFKMLENADLPEKMWLTTLQTLDKIDRKGNASVKNELTEKGLSEEKAAGIISYWTALKPQENDESLVEIENYLKLLGVDQNSYKFDPTLVRGLDYYTGPIFETVVEKPKIGSITGGGRYDRLIAQLGGPETPATGTTIGLDRICDVISELGLLEKELEPAAQALITIFSPELLGESIKLTNQLRAEGVNINLYPDPETRLDKQLKYADRGGIPYAIILGPQEIEKGQATIKNMETGEQLLVPTDNIHQEIEK